MLCEYGCLKNARYLLKNGKQCCEKSSNSCPESKRKNSEGIKAGYKKGRKKAGLSGDDENSRKIRERSRISFIINLKLKPFEEWGSKLKFELILEEQTGKCLCCGLNQEWNGKLLKFELDHIDGNNLNNKRENLRLICPNCHSQTETWKGKGHKNKKGIKVVSDEILLDALQTTKNIRQALIKVGLSGKGYNYLRAQKLLLNAVLSK